MTAQWLHDQMETCDGYHQRINDIVSQVYDDNLINQLKTVFTERTKFVNNLRSIIIKYGRYTWASEYIVEMMNYDLYDIMMDTSTQVNQLQESMITSIHKFYQSLILASRFITEARESNDRQSIITATVTLIVAMILHLISLFYLNMTINNHLIELINLLYEKSHGMRLRYNQHVRIYYARRYLNGIESLATNVVTARTIEKIAQTYIIIQYKSFRQTVEQRQSETIDNNDECD